MRGLPECVGDRWRVGILGSRIAGEPPPLAIDRRQSSPSSITLASTTALHVSTQRSRDTHCPCSSAPRRQAPPQIVHAGCHTLDPWTFSGCAGPNTGLRCHILDPQPLGASTDWLQGQPPLWIAPQPFWIPQPEGHFLHGARHQVTGPSKTIRQRRLATSLVLGSSRCDEGGLGGWWFGGEFRKPYPNKWCCARSVLKCPTFG